MISLVLENKPRIEGTLFTVSGGNLSGHQVILGKQFKHGRKKL